MHIDLSTGLLARAKQVLSPHFDVRPQDTFAYLIVIHGISLPPGKFGGAWIDRLFTGTLDPDAHPFFRDLARQRVSAHALIRRDGSIVQYVPFQARAWHAGESEFEGRSVCNDFPSLSDKRVVGHSDIAPGRKTDPGGAFDWQRLRRSLA